MEDILKHAFDTVVVGLFATCCFALSVLYCFQSVRDRVAANSGPKDEHVKTLMSFALWLLLPVSYIVGSVSFAMGDELFNEKPRGLTEIATRFPDWLGTDVEADSTTRRKEYTKQAAAVCSSRFESASSPVLLAKKALCVRTGKEIPISDEIVKPLYTYQKYSLLIDSASGSELRVAREHLVIVRGAATALFALFWLGYIGTALSLVRSWSMAYEVEKGAPFRLGESMAKLARLLRRKVAHRLATGGAREGGGRQGLNPNP